MPELPEVETVRRGLEPTLVGAVVETVELFRPALRIPFPEGFAARLSGRRIESLGRRSKYLLAGLDDGATLLVHLGMSGSLRLDGGAAMPDAYHHAVAKDPAHDHVVFHFRDGVRLLYNDPRRFGLMDLVAAGDLNADPRLAVLGPEPLGNAFGADVLDAAFAGRAAPLKALLLDQSVVAGLGNIYVCEALWRAGLSPFRPAGSLAGPAAAPAREALVRAISDVLAEAIAAGGSSLRDYVHADGSLGYFQHAFAVYDREGEPCPRPGCGGTIVRRRQSGRSTFLCERCQR